MSNLPKLERQNYKAFIRVASFILIILIMQFFLIIEVEKVIEGYTTSKEIVEQWGITPRRSQVLCNKEKISGTVKFGRDWAVPMNAESQKTVDFATGEYKKWRNK